MDSSDEDASRRKRRKLLFNVPASNSNLLEQLVGDGLSSEIPTSIDPNSDDEEEQRLDFDGSDIEDPDWIVEPEDYDDSDTDSVLESQYGDSDEDFTFQVRDSEPSSTAGPSGVVRPSGIAGPSGNAEPSDIAGPSGTTGLSDPGVADTRDGLTLECDWRLVTAGTPHNFVEFPDEPKIKCEIENPQPIDIFCHFIGDEMWEYMVQETNRYARQYLTNEALKDKSRAKEWLPTTVEEMKKFVGIIICMGLVQAPEINLYWSKNDLYSNKLIKDTMSRDRFLLIRKFWHFSNNAESDMDDRLSKIKKIVEYLNLAFTDSLIPGKGLVIDETMIPWRGRLVFRQYIRNKAHKYGVKLYKLCTPEGYTLRVSIYQGKKATRPSTKGHTYDVVMELLGETDEDGGFLDKGRTVFTDNFYTGIPLAEALLERKTRICGTLSSKRRGLPDGIKVKVNKGKCKGFQCQHGTKIIKWTDKRSVTMLSTVPDHSSNLVDTGKRDRKGDPKLKPDCVIDYNNAKKGVDYSDQMSAYQTAVRKSLKWYKKVGIELITGTTMVNSWILFSKMARRMPIYKFREEVARGLMGRPNLNVTGISPYRRKPHTLAKTEGIGRKKRRRCTVCYGKNRANFSAREADKKTKQVSTFCKDCPNTPFMCLECFNSFHT